MDEYDEINEIKKDLLFIDDEIENIQRQQIYIERISPIDIKIITPVGIFLLLLGFSFAVSTYFGIVFGSSGILIVITAILAVIFIYAGAKLARIGIKSKRISKRTEEIVQRAEEIRERLEKRISK